MLFRIIPMPVLIRYDVLFAIAVCMCFEIPRLGLEGDDLDTHTRIRHQIMDKSYNLIFWEYKWRIERSSNPIPCSVQPVYSEFIFEKRFYFCQIAILVRTAIKPIDTYVCHK